MSIARELGYPFLGSGVLYRLVAYALNENIPLDPFLEEVQSGLRFDLTDADADVFIGQKDMSPYLHGPEVSNQASTISQSPEIRQKLFHLQRSFNKGEGLVAEGRDMGTVVFPEASVKFFLYADIYVRAERRHRQLARHGIQSSIEEMAKRLASRDEQDQNRTIAPLEPADDAIIIDTAPPMTELFDTMMKHINKTLNK